MRQPLMQVKLVSVRILILCIIKTINGKNVRIPTIIKIVSNLVDKPLSLTKTLKGRSCLNKFIFFFNS